MTDEQPEKGTKENPYTREDVLKKIEAAGGPENTNLSGMRFEKGIDLRGLNNNQLQGITLDKARFPLSLRRDALLRGANLKCVHLEGASLRSTHLEEADLSDAYLNNANLGSAHLEGANLMGTHLGSAYLGGAHLQGAILQSAEFSRDTGLESVDWGNYILGDESMGLDVAADTYRRLKVWYTSAGIYDTAGEFFFKEMTAQRKRIKWWPESRHRSWKRIKWLLKSWHRSWRVIKCLLKSQHRSWKVIKWLLHPRHRIWSAIHDFVSGYGERPLRVVRFGVLVLFGSTLLYFFLRGVAPHTLTVHGFLNSLYYSAVSFTALGYGPWFNDTSVRSWVQGAGATEAFIGVFTIALFLVTFTRKMRR